MIRVENAEARRAQMLVQATEVLAEARRLEAFANRVTTVVAGTLAWGLRNQGMSDREIGKVLPVSRNRVAKLVNAGKWPTEFGRVAWDEREEMRAAVAAIYGRIGHAGPGWIQTRQARSGDICADNKVPIPGFYSSAGALDLDGAQFDNAESGERILVYSLHRHNGWPLFATGGRFVKHDHRGEYRIDLCVPGGARQALPLQILGLAPVDVRFGIGWPEQQIDTDLVFQTVTESVRRHYGIWPLAALSVEEL